jgi:hypothetical protein
MSASSWKDEEESDEKSQSGQSVSWPIFEPNVSRMRKAGVLPLE